MPGSHQLIHLIISKATLLLIYIKSGDFLESVPAQVLLTITVDCNLAQFCHQRWNILMTCPARDRCCNDKNTDNRMRLLRYSIESPLVCVSICLPPAFIQQMYNLVDAAFQLLRVLDVYICTQSSCQHPQACWIGLKQSGCSNALLQSWFNTRSPKASRM